MNILDTSLILQIAKYCDIDELNNLSKTNQYIHQLRLYRLFYGIIFKREFELNCIQDVKKYKNDGTYNLNHYLKDILSCIHYIPRCRPLIFSSIYMFGNSSDWYSTTQYNLEQTKKYWRTINDREHKVYPIRVCSIYRISFFRKRLYKRNNGLNVFAIIY
jgi:hypothetical protein